MNFIVFFVDTCQSELMVPVNRLKMNIIYGLTWLKISLSQHTREIVGKVQYCVVSSVSK